VAKTITLSGRAVRVAVVGSLLLIVFPALFVSVAPVVEALNIPGGSLTAFAVAAAIPAAIGGLLVARSRDGSDGSVWGAIPEEQYSGRHAESGGIARQEQETALDRLGDEK